MTKTSLIAPSTRQINRICNRGILKIAHDEIERVYGPMPEEPTQDELKRLLQRFVDWSGALFAATAISEAVRYFDRNDVIDARLVWMALNANIMERKEPPF